MDRLTYHKPANGGSSATQSYQRRFSAALRLNGSRRVAFQRSSREGTYGGANLGPLSSLSVGFEAEQQRVQVLGVLFFDGKDVAHHSVRRWVLAVQIRDDLAVAFDRNALGD